MRAEKREASALSLVPRVPLFPAAGRGSAPLPGARRDVTAGGVFTTAGCAHAPDQYRLKCN